MLTAIAAHRARSCASCPTPCAERTTLDLGAAATACPIGRWCGFGPEPIVTPGAAAPARRPAAPTREEIGRALWAELHTRARRAVDLTGEAEWLAGDFAARVPALGCSCQAAWRAILNALPPRLDSPVAYFEWSVAVHNRINAKLGKPLLSFAAATARWH